MIDFDNTVLAAGQAAFGEQVTYCPKGGQPMTVIGIFDDRWIDDKFTDAVDVTTTRTVLNVRASTLAAAPQQDDQVQMRGRSYIVAEPPEPDTFGDVRLYLRLENDAQAAITPTPPVPPS